MEVSSESSKCLTDFILMQTFSRSMKLAVGYHLEETYYRSAADNIGREHSLDHVQGGREISVILLTVVGDG